MSTTNQQKFLNQNPLQQQLIGRFHRRFLELLRTIQPASILEVGSGEGYLLSTIAKEFPRAELLGVDINRQALAEGQRLFPDLRLEFGDIYHLSQSDRTWDVVIASEVLEHLDHPVAALRELCRVSSRALLLSVPNEPWFRLSNFARGRHFRRFGNHPEHVNLWSVQGFRRFVAKQAPVDQVTTSYPWTILRAHV